MRRKGFRVRALTFQFAGIAAGELKAARAVARAAGVGQRLVRLPDLREASDIKGAGFPGLPPTYIPMRNAIFYSLAASYAEEVKADLVVGGHNRDDAKVFRDVSPDFFNALERAFRRGSRVLDGRKTRILRPLSSRSKPDVIRLAASLGVPLGLTWSCHRAGWTHCWRCGGCRGRRTSFQRAGVADPLLAHS